MIKSSKSDYTLQTCHHLLDGLQTPRICFLKLLVFHHPQPFHGADKLPDADNGGWAIPSQTLVPYDESDYKCLVIGTASKTL